MVTTWENYKAEVSQHISARREFIYRGQSNSDWKLKPTLYRTSMVRSFTDLKMYADFVLPQVHTQVEAWVGKSWNLADSLGLAEFLAYLQHHGFPTPLLDWTYSPYIAAYFAFEGVNHFSPQSEFVSIYAFNSPLWSSSFKQHYDFADFTPHISVLSPRAIGNHKLALQQGLFTWTTVPDVEDHIRTNEAGGKEFLTKFVLASEERPKVMRELSLMGITAVQLMPSVEAVCKKALEDLVCRVPVGI